MQRPIVKIEVEGNIYESIHSFGCGNCVARSDELDRLSPLCAKISHEYQKRPDYNLSETGNCCSYRSWKLVQKKLATLADGTDVFLGDKVYHERIPEGAIVRGINVYGEIYCVIDPLVDMWVEVISFDNKGITKTPYINPVVEVVDGFLHDTKLLARVNALKAGKKLMMKLEGYAASHIFQMSPQKNVIRCLTGDFSDDKIDSFILWGYGEWFILDEVEEEVTETMTKIVKKTVEVKL